MSETKPEETSTPGAGSAVKTGGGDKTGGVGVKDSDLQKLMLLGGIVLALIVLFWAALYGQGLLAFPDVGAGEAHGDPVRYHQDALVYRERRIALALVLRTFITGLAFVVGLVMCTQGGIFILRQVTSHTQVSVGLPPHSDGQTPPRQPLFELAAYSPGVVFMLGGLALMVATQKLAIEIEVIEVVPAHAQQMCVSADGIRWHPCETARESTPAPALARDQCTGAAGQPDYCHHGSSR